MEKCPNGELRDRAELRAEVREAKVELECLDALRNTPSSDLCGSKLRDMVHLTGALAERVVKIKKDLDQRSPETDPRRSRGRRHLAPRRPTMRYKSYFGVISRPIRRLHVSNKKLPVPPKSRCLAFEVCLVSELDDLL